MPTRAHSLQRGFGLLSLVGLLAVLSAVLVSLSYMTQQQSQITSIENENHQFKASPIGGEDLVQDPICHTYVPLSQAFKKEISGNDYYFCSKQCSEKYALGKNK